MEGLYRASVVLPNAEFNMQVEDGRVIATGPLPGNMMFTSFAMPEIGGINDALATLQSRWSTMNEKKRDEWYGPKGKYTKTKYPLMLPGYQGEWDR